MPLVFHQPESRREFLRGAVVGAAAVFVAGCQTTRQAGAGGEEVRLALLSDTHIPADRTNGHRGFIPADNLRQVVSGVLAARPEGAVLSGDAARLEGKPEDYAELRTLLGPLAAACPITIGLGNHDDRASYLAAFPQPAGQNPAVQGKHVTVLEYPALRVVVLDSLQHTNKVEGFLGQAQRQWLIRTLPQFRDRPAVLVVHHTLGEADGDLLDTDRLFALLRGQRHVKAIFYGHSHVWAMSERQGIRLINLPAVGYNFRDQDPVGWVDARFHRRGVALTLRVVGGKRDEDGRTTALRWS